MRNLVRALFFVFPDVLLCWCEGFVIVFDVFLLRVNPLNSRGAEIGALTYGVPIDHSTICCLFFIHVPQYVVLLIRKKRLKLVNTADLSVRYLEGRSSEILLRLLGGGG